jgi:NAD+ kinase
MIGLIAHTQKQGAASVVQTIVNELRRSSLPFLMERATAALIGENSELSEKMLAERVDLLLVMGGDGSILRALHHIGPHLRPIFGLNIGSLGFLTCLPAQEYQRALQCIIDKEYLLSHRTLLELKIDDRSHVLALNDIVISRGQRSQLIRLLVAIDGTPLMEYHADGLIISTPTGSTAYSLAAGGPIVMPESQTLIITPICPHVFSNRSLVINDKSHITIEAPGEQQIFIALDGREPYLMQPQEHLLITTAQERLPLAMLPNTSFSQILRQKLKWSGSNF